MEGWKNGKTKRKKNWVFEGWGEKIASRDQERAKERGERGKRGRRNLNQSSTEKLTFDCRVFERNQRDREAVKSGG